MATTGPQSFGQESSLCEAGATRIRLNASHLAPVEVFEHVARITSLSPSIQCVIDLQGAKMRLSRMVPLAVTQGQTLRLTLDAHEARAELPDSKRAVYVPHRELFEQVQSGELLSVDDGRLELCVTEKSATTLTVTCAGSHLIESRKGINRQSHPVELDDLGPDDQSVLQLCRALSNVSYAVSFASHGREANWVKSRIKDAHVTLKVERSEAINSLHQLARHADELWICRGDLGAQLGYRNLGQAIRAIEPKSLGIPVLMAGQVLQHLTYHNEPTRSEICHADDLLARGYAGYVLSDETAIGRDPVNATRWARRLLDAHKH